MKPDRRAAAMQMYGFADVLSLEAMVEDLREWDDPRWRASVADLRVWTNALYDGLT